ncbi:MAG TPA: protein-glutamate O-methyltransferase CheR [bacterium]|nr:protein-glutamate O-methyltransferase CheR [bacterium]
MADVSERMGEGYREILDFIGRTRGLDFSQWRPGCLMRRIDHRVRASGAGDLASYLKFLQKTPGEIEKLVNSIAINVTEFFRNPEVFEALGRTVVPKVVSEALEKGYPRIRVWGAGSSNGAEAFTLAILFAEEFEKRGVLLPLSIQGTDIDREAIAEAEAGRYEASMFKGAPAGLLSKYFTKSGKGYAVADSIRLLVKFRYHDMVGHRPPVANDLVVCRNVLIYFSRELQARAIDNFWKALRSGGFLVLGQTESLKDSAGRFSVVDPRLRIYTKK